VFRPVPADLDLVALEQSMLAEWEHHRIFERSVERRHGSPEWVFFEGPPTANGRPGLHHVWARAYKDLFCRYRTMRGYRVERRAGWDTHGLPVEVEVEKAMGISSKREIEALGIDTFVERCRASVLSYVEQWKALTTRIGYWVDLDAAYWTFDTDYVQSVWWHLRHLFDQGLLYQDTKVVPYCPRCGTALSSHELGQPGAYREIEDQSAYVVFPVDAGLADGRSDPHIRALVAWTTTPWTLLSNTGLAVHPDLTYAVVDGMVVAEALVEAVFGDGAVVTATVAGRDLVGLRYRRPFDDVAAPRGADGWRVVAGTFVTTDEGTGVVHLAPAFGEIDRQVGRSSGLPTLNPVDAAGRFTDAVPWLAGRPVRETNGDVNRRLEDSGVLLRRQVHRHSYPHCWRCGTALIYWGKPSWYVATSSRKADLMAANETVAWHPGYIKEGRFGEWLANNVDWALSRDRYWGTPLPIWQCEAGHLRCVGSLAELSELAGRDVTGTDPHRPAIDAVVVPCPDCAGAGTPGATEMRRVEPVIDAWFDSGSMPAAQVGYPHAAGSQEALRFPADFITEAIDQTRGWFYSLLAVNTLVFGSAPYRHVMCLGHIVDADGRKMSKSLGNVVDPWEILDTRGADALRWWMFSQGSPWTPTRVSLEVIDTAMRDTLLTFWNTLSFFVTYASLNAFTPEATGIPPVHARSDLDRWVLSRLAATTAEVTAGLDAYEPLRAAGALASLADDVSNWYVRRSRRRFWRTDPGSPPEDALAAQATLHAVLVRFAVLLAPFCPFLADHAWRNLTGAPPEGSVHLADWPDGELDIDDDLHERMAQARRLASLGRSARSEAGVKVRQPLARALVLLPPGAPHPLAGVVEAELNVDEVVVTHDLAAVLSMTLVPNFRVLGPRLGRRAQELRTVLAELDPADAADAAERLERGEPVEVELASGGVELVPGDVEVRVTGQPGFSASREGGEVVALDLTLTPELVRRGTVREVVRQVQELRKTEGLAVSDRIRLWVTGLEELASHAQEIAREVLAVEVIFAAGPGSGSVLTVDGAGDGDAPPQVWIERA